MNVVPFTRPTKPHVIIESGRVTKSSDGSMLGQWCFMVDFVDEDGTVLHDYIGPDYAKAGRIAIEFAREYNCRIIDRSEEEPKR